MSEEVWDREEGYLYTMAPPLRSAHEKELLRSMISDVMVIGTDHCPFMRAEKQKEKLHQIPLGVGGIEHSFSVMYNFFGDKIIDKMTINPAKLHGLYPQKGIIQEGSDADFAVIAVEDGRIARDHSRSDYYVYEGLEVKTKLRSTLVRGRFVVREGLLLKHQGAYIQTRGGLGL